ncbi:hypothetical protein QBC39DRAFT_251447 [Podospora conica]|nr:hypothetical protein QBC39DRAFT_251447 [Schizothecium conicum]
MLSSPVQNPSIATSCAGFESGKAYCVLGEPDGKATPSPSSTTTATFKTSSTPTSTPTSAFKSTSVPTFKSSSSKTTTISPTSTTGNGIPTPTPTQPGLVSNCDAFHLVKLGDTCATIPRANGITVAQFASWNAGVGGKSCPTMWADVYACASIVGHNSTLTAPRNGVSTP